MAIPMESQRAMCPATTPATVPNPAPNAIPRPVYFGLFIAPLLVPLQCSCGDSRPFGFAQGRLSRLSGRVEDPAALSEKPTPKSSRAALDWTAGGGCPHIPSLSFCYPRQAALVTYLRSAVLSRATPPAAFPKASRIMPALVPPFSRCHP